MNDWISQKFRQVIGQPISGSRPKGGANSETDGIPSLGGENILSDGGVTYANLNRVPDVFFRSMPKGRLQPMDVLINKDGAQTGKVGLYRGEFAEACVNEHLFILRNNDGTLDQRFLYYSVLFPETQTRIQRRITGSAQPGLNSQFVDAVEISFPRLPEKQRRIADILETVDKAIQQTEALIAKQQQVKAGLMHDLFTRGLTPDGQLRPAGTERKTKFGWLPKDWRIGSLADNTSAARQPILTGPFGADLGNDDFVEEGVPLLRIGNVQTGRIDVGDLLYVTPIKAAQLERYRIRSGDLLFARQGATTGRNALASDEVDGWLINYHIIRVALDHSLCAPVFIEAAFNEEMVLRQVERDKGRGTREGINSEQLRSLELPLPPDRDEQVRIADRLVAQHRAIATETAHLGKLRQVKQGLMQALLTPPS